MQYEGNLIWILEKCIEAVNKKYFNVPVAFFKSVVALLLWQSLSFYFVSHLHNITKIEEVVV